MYNILKQSHLIIIIYDLINFESIITSKIISGTKINSVFLDKLSFKPAFMKINDRKKIEVGRKILILKQINVNLLINVILF